MKSYLALTIGAVPAAMFALSCVALAQGATESGAKAINGIVNAKAIYCDATSSNKDNCDSRIEASEIAILARSPSPRLTPAQLAAAEKSLLATVLITRKTFVVPAAQGFKLVPEDRAVRFPNFPQYPDAYPLCPPDIGAHHQQKFWDQQKAGRCTGFLISANRVATAGHCAKSSEDPAQMRIVFNFRQLASGPKTDYRADEVYGVKRVVKQSDQPDFAVLELDRAVPASVATPLELASGGPTDRLGKLVGLMGYPNGIPLKVSFADKNKVIATGTASFSAALDAFQGNSGSPVVLREAPGTVVGILVNGNGDYEPIEDQGHVCAMYATYKDAQAGEWATDISVVASFQN